MSGRRDLAAIFDDVLDYSMELFGADRAGLWLSDDGPVGFRLAGRRGLSDEFLEVVTRIAQDPAAPSARAAAARRPLVIGDPFRGAVTPELRRLYRTEGIRTACFVPVVFLDEPLGLLILYHLAPHEWPDEELELVGSFADQMATAIENARLYGSVRGFAARLEAIKDLAGRLARISDVGAIGSAIVAEVRSLYESDTARVYTVDHETGMCEPVAFGGVFLGVEDPPADVLRVAIGKGLTGWVAAHATPVRVADSRYDPRRLVVGPDEEPESMLLAPMTYEDTVRGVLVVSKKGIDRYSADDLTTLSIFAGFAAQALVNAENLGRLHDQQAELERRLASQRSLLDVNETLLSARDPHAVLDVIADSLRSVVRYDNLTIYRLERDRGVRVAVLARDRYAEVILAEQIPVGVGLTGWAVDRGEAVLANDAHLHPRAAQIPGTPAEPESLIVVPLRIGGDVIGTLNIGRMGEAEAHFSKDEFELTQLFAGQAAIALQNAEAIQAAETRARLDALTGLRNHGAFQADFDEMLARESSAQVPGPFAVLMLDLDGFKAFNDARGHPAGDNLLRVIADALGKGVRPDDRVYRYGGDEFAAILPGVGADEARKVARRVARAIDDVGTHADGPWVTVSVGAAAFPLDGRTKDELVIRADTELYLEKAARHSARGIAGPGSPSHAAAVAAVHESTFAIMARRDPSELLETIVTRAAALTGTEHGFLDLVDAEGVLRVAAAIGAFAGIAAHQVAPGAGVDGRVWESGEPVLVEDYDAWPDRPRELSVGRLGSVVGVPLTAGGAVVGVIGLASGAGGRIFNAADVVTLTRFARLASFALENARLHDSARAALVERERAEEELRARAEGLRRLAEASSEQALYDGLTGLPNRQLFLDRIEHAIGCAGPGEAAWSGVLLLDLDRFKVINESLGHVAGDQLLVAVARRLADVVRPDDTIGRLGGDEFGVLLAGVATEEAAVAVAQRLLDTLTAPFLLEGREAFVGASVGIALGRPGSSSATDLLREADVALYRAKGSPTVRHAVFTPGMSAAPLERLDLESDLRRAVERDELRLHYQPLIDLRSGRVVGHEALLRWQHPIRGLVGPYSFIPLAEETGLIVPIGAWVLLEACRQTREWQLDVPGVPNLIVSVNLSARQLARPDLADQVAATLRATGLDPACLELEITESIAMREAMAAGATLRRLHELGIRLVLDDFGTGYSSLAYLSQLQLDSIKVDRAFIAGITEDPANVSIIRAVAALAHGLGIEVTAEGIELPEQLAAVRELGCDRGQGFLFARPLPAGDAARALAAGLAAA